MSAWDLIIFDNDGVLVDSEHLANQVLAGLLTAAGRPYTAARCQAEFLGGTIERVRQLVEAQDRAEPAGPGGRGSHRVGGPLPADFETLYHQGVAAAFGRELKPVAGVEAALDDLHIPTCVASSGTHERIRLALTTTGLLSRFEDRIFSAEDVRQGKPAPDLLLHAAAVMGAEPARCAVVEDSPLGVQAARAAGMTVFGYAAVTGAERLADSSAVFTSMAALPALLRQHQPPS